MGIRRLALVALCVSPMIVGKAAAQAPVRPSASPPASSLPVTIMNTTPVAVAVPGGITVSGGVAISNTPNVNVANTPSVTVANTPNVNVANTPSVTVANTLGVNAAQSGTWNVGVTTPVSLAAGTSVMVTQAAPPQPYVFTDEGNGGPIVAGYHPKRVFGPVSPNTRLAISTAIFANASNTPWFIEVYSDDCGGNNERRYLYPLTQPLVTFVVSFPSPLVIASSGAWCLNVRYPADGALYPFTLVGYVM